MTMKMHKAIAISMWQMKLWKDPNLEFQGLLEHPTVPI